MRQATSETNTSVVYNSDSVKCEEVVVPKPSQPEESSPVSRDPVPIIKSPQKKRLFPTRKPTGARPGRPRKRILSDKQPSSTASNTSQNLTNTRNNEDELISADENEISSSPIAAATIIVGDERFLNGNESPQKTNGSESAPPHNSSHSTPLKRVIAAAANAINERFPSFSRSLTKEPSSKSKPAATNGCYEKKNGHHLKEANSNSSTSSRYESAKSSRSSSESSSATRNATTEHFLSNKEVLDDEAPIETIKKSHDETACELMTASLIEKENVNLSGLQICDDCDNSMTIENVTVISESKTALNSIPSQSALELVKKFEQLIEQAKSNQSIIKEIDNSKNLVEILSEPCSSKFKFMANQ